MLKWFYLPCNRRHHQHRQRVHQQHRYQNIGITHQFAAKVPWSIDAFEIWPQAAKKFSHLRLPRKPMVNVTSWDLTKLAGGFKVSTHLKNMQPSDWIISPSMGENKKYLKPSPRNTGKMTALPVSLWIFLNDSLFYREKKPSRNTWRWPKSCCYTDFQIRRFQPHTGCFQVLRVRNSLRFETLWKVSIYKQIKYSTSSQICCLTNKNISELPPPTQDSSHHQGCSIFSRESQPKF